MSDEIKKRQHYVPKFYLRRFLNAKNELEILDFKERQILTPNGARGVCHGDFFYSVQTGQMDDVGQAMEHGFDKLENIIAREIDPIVRKILTDQQILPHEKWMISLFMSMLWIRGPEMRSRVNGIHEQVMKHVGAVHAELGLLDRIIDDLEKKSGAKLSSAEREEMKRMFAEGDYAVQSDNTLHLDLIQDMAGFANLFAAQHWDVFISKPTKRFVTTDNPVAVISPKLDGPYPPGFLQRTHYFALTPNICIKASEPANSGKKFRRTTLFRGHEAEVLDLNIRIANCAIQLVFASDKSSLEDIVAEAKSQDALFSTREGKRIKEILKAGTQAQ